MIGLVPNAKVLVLSLFVPLCISTGGNSGSQAATLITRAMALGQVNMSDWWRVLRHEIGMGVVLGVTLGVIGFGRASLTPESVRGNSPPRHEPFTVTVPASQPLEFHEEPKKAWLGKDKTLHQFAHEYWPEDSQLADIRVITAPGLDPALVDRMGGRRR